MKRILWLVVIVVLVIVVLLTRSNKGMDNVYSVLPDNVLMTCEVKNLNNEINFINSLGFSDGDILAPLFKECNENERKVANLMVDVLGHKFLVAYKGGRLEEKISLDEDVVLQDILENLIMVSKPLKQISASFIKKSLSSFVNGTVVAEYNGVTINTFEIEESKEPIFISYCVVDGTVLCAFSVDTLKQVIDTASGKLDNNFTKTELYKKLRLGASDKDVYSMSFDVSKFMKTYVNILDAVALSAMENKQTNVVVELKEQMAAFKDMYDGFGYGVGYVGRNDSEFYARNNGSFDSAKLDNFYKTIFTADRSAAEMLKYHAKEPLFSYAVNFGIQEYINILIKALPENEVAEMKSSFAINSGIDLDVMLRCLGNGISVGLDEFQYSTLIPNISMRILMGVSEQHDAFIPTLIKLAAITEMPMSNKNIAGIHVNYASIPFTALQPSFAVKNDTLLFATSLEIMGELVQGLKKENSLNANVEFKKFLGDENLFGWYYVDLKQMIDIWGNVYANFKPFVVGKVPEEIISDYNVENNLARAKMLQKLYMKAYTKGNEYFSEMVIKYDKNYAPVVEEVEVIADQE